MFAVKGKSAHTNQWYDEKRNVYKDLIAAFGDRGSHQANKDRYRYIDAIAIMTDTDNSGAKVTAWYGEIFFTKE